MLEKPSEIHPLIQQIMKDYRESQAFFVNHHLPEYTLLDELDLPDHERAIFLPLTYVTNHIHDGTGASKKTDGADL